MPPAPPQVRGSLSDDRAPPSFVAEIPADRRLQTAFEASALAPAQFVADAGCIGSVAQVVVRAVGDEANLFGIPPLPRVVTASRTFSPRS
jgi:hypothetical protein